MTTTFCSKPEQDCHITFCSLIKSNEGFFKSQAQSSFILSGKLVATYRGHDKDPVEEVSKRTMSYFNIPLVEGQDLISIEGNISFADYGRKSQRRLGWMYIIDQFGIVAQYKLHYTYNDNNTSSCVNKEKTEKVWSRTSTELPAFKSPEQAAIEKQAANIEANKDKSFIGNIKDRLIFEGTIKSIVLLGFKEMAYHTMASYKTVILTDDGNTLIYWGAMRDVEEGQRIKVKATVKDHSEYQGIKQTIIARPTLIESVK